MVAQNRPSGQYRRIGKGPRIRVANKGGPDTLSHIQEMRGSVFVLGGHPNGDIRKISKAVTEPRSDSTL